MKAVTHADYGRLHEYLCDMITEEQIKLGYEKETIRFYSPCHSVANILRLEKKDCDYVMQALGDFGSYAKDTLGAVNISSSGARICFCIPAEGAAYVHENREKNPFLEELIACFGRHGVTRSEVTGLFQKWSEHVQCIHIGNDEFDDVFYFSDGRPDAYRYCVKFDAGHAFYHRFLKEDFEELMEA